MQLIGKVFTAIAAVIVKVCEGFVQYATAFESSGKVVNNYVETLIPSDEDYQKQMELATQRRQAAILEQEDELAKQLEKFNKAKANKPTVSLD